MNHVNWYSTISGYVHYGLLLISPTAINNAPQLTHIIQSYTTDCIISAGFDSYKWVITNNDNIPSPFTMHNITWQNISAPFVMHKITFQLTASQWVKNEFQLSLKAIRIPPSSHNSIICASFYCCQTLASDISIFQLSSNKPLKWNALLTIDQRKLTLIVGIKMLDTNKKKHVQTTNKQQFEWNIKDKILSKMKTASYGICFLSPIIHSLFSVKIFPNGRPTKKKGQVCICLQWMGVPAIMHNKLIPFSIHCQAIDIATNAIHKFSYDSSCAYCTDNLLSFAELKLYNNFIINISVNFEAIFLAKQHVVDVVDDNQLRKRKRKRKPPSKKEKKKENVIDIHPNKPPHAPLPEIKGEIAHTLRPFKPPLPHRSSVAIPPCPAPLELDPLPHPNEISDEIPPQFHIAVMEESQIDIGDISDADEGKESVISAAAENEKVSISDKDRLDVFAAYFNSVEQRFDDIFRKVEAKFITLKQDSLQEMKQQITEQITEQMMTQRTEIEIVSKKAKETEEKYRRQKQKLQIEVVTLKHNLSDYAQQIYALQKEMKTLKKQQNMERNDVIGIQQQIDTINVNFVKNDNGKEKELFSVETGVTAQGQKVIIWLTEMVGLPQYIETFINNGFDCLDIIADINDNDLSELGIFKRGHRKKIIKCVVLLMLFNIIMFMH